MLVADRAEVDVEGLSIQDFIERLYYACSNRWGFMIKSAIDIFFQCRMNGKGQVNVKDFAEVFAKKTGIPAQYSLFTEPDFREAFDFTKLLTLDE